MVGGLDPTEESDGSITVRLLDDAAEPKEIRFSSYYDTIDVVKEHQYTA